MADRIFSVKSWTPTAVADATNYTDNKYMALLGGAAGQVNKIKEVHMGGFAAASAPTSMVLGLDSTVGVTLTALATATFESDGPMHISAVALATTVKAFTASTTKPQRANTVTLPRLSLPFNAFGGRVDWIAAPGQEFTTVGASASGGEASLSADTGGTPGLMGSSIIYEPM